MDDSTSKLSLPLIMPAQAQKHVTHNEALALLDALVQPTAEDRNRTAPPAAPIDGQTHIVAPNATGAWEGMDGSVALFLNGGWVFLAPRAGWIFRVLDETTDIRYDGFTWEAVSTSGVQFGKVGINTAPDSVNKLSLNSAAALFNHDGAGHQLKINKAAANQTASLVFQDGFSGRAEMGLAGNDNFSIKVSADGAAFTEALSIAADTGLATGAAVVQTSTDTGAGKLLKVGAGHAQLDASLYRKGNVVGTVSQSGGVPTGAVVQRGSNANGELVRFADGTQICTRRLQIDGVSIATAMGSVFRADLGNFAFPATFNSVDAVSATLLGSGNSTIASSASVLKLRQGATASGASWDGLSLWSPVSITGTAGQLTHISLLAIGRWY